MNKLKSCFDYYISNQDALVHEYEGRVLVIVDQKVVGVYDSELEAYEHAKVDYPMGEFLIQRCSPGPASYTHTFHSCVAVP